MRAVLAFLAVCLASAKAGSVDLNKANIESEMAGKNSFIKFQAPW